jgi:ribosomal protein L40E
LNPARVKRVLFASAMILAAIAFTTIFVPLSSHVYTVEEEKPYPTVTSWTTPWTSTSTVTSYSSKTAWTLADNPDDSYGPDDIDRVVLIREYNLIHIYLILSHGTIGLWPSDRAFLLSIAFESGGLPDYTAWFYYKGCELIYYPGERGFKVADLQYDFSSDTLHVIIPVSLIGEKTTFYFWAQIVYSVKGKLYPADEVPEGPSGEYMILEPVTFTHTLERTYIYTSTLSSIYMTNSTETHTLTEKVSLSYWHGWLPYPFFAGAGAAAITLCLSEAIPYIKSKRKKAAPVIALPEGARLVKLCPSCGAENPLDAEYCHECGAKQPPAKEEM